MYCFSNDLARSLGNIKIYFDGPPLLNSQAMIFSNVWEIAAIIGALIFGQLDLP